MYEWPQKKKEIYSRNRLVTWVGRPLLNSYEDRAFYVPTFFEAIRPLSRCSSWASKADKCRLRGLLVTFHLGGKEVGTFPLRSHVFGLLWHGRSCGSVAGENARN